MGRAQRDRRLKPPGMSPNVSGNDARPFEVVLAKFTSKSCCLATISLAPGFLGSSLKLIIILNKEVMKARKVSRSNDGIGCPSLDLAGSANSNEVVATVRCVQSFVGWPGDENHDDTSETRRTTQ